MTSARFSSVLTLCLMGLLLAEAAPFSSGSSSSTTIKWVNCTSLDIDAPKLQCGNFSVPMNHDKPSAGNVNLLLFKIPAQGKNKLGSLIYNPGGPGYSAQDLMTAASDGTPLFSNDLLAAYDFIGYDPRGVGLSTPVKCDPNIGNERVSAFPRNEQEYSALVDHNRRFGESCAKLTGQLINYLDTTNVAKDLELVRKALGGAKLNFFGQSYGSQLGYQYAELYPQNINRMLLDGILDHTTSETNTVAAESQTYELVLNDFFSWCNKTANCTLKGQDVAKIWTFVTDQSYTSVIPAPGCVNSGACRANATREEIRWNAQEFLLFQNTTAEILDGWDLLAQALSEAYAGNATLLSTPLASDPSSSLFASLAIGCQDWSHGTTTLAELNTKMRPLRTFSPRTQGSTQSYWYQTSCIGWPTKVTNPQRRIDSAAAGKAPPIVLLQSTLDPSCSYNWAVNVQSQLPGSVLVTRVGAGHTSYHLPGASRAVADAFLIGGKVPAKDTVVYS